MILGFSKEELPPRTVFPKIKVPKTNNFDLLRHVCAIVVVIFHVHVATGQLDFMPKLNVITKSAVPMFYVISGFLIFMSYENSKSLKEYAFKRLRRIYPAFIAVIILAALLGVSVSTLSPSDYFSHPKFFKYIFYNSIFLNFLQPTLPQVFTENLKAAVNPSLWTIRIEVMFYCCVPIIVFLMRRYSRLRVLLGIYLASAIFRHGVIFLYQMTGRMFYYKLSVKFLIGDLAFFVAGALLYYYLDFFKKHSSRLVIGALPLYVAAYYGKLFFLQPICLAIIMFYLVFLTPHIGLISRFGDFSYGIYLFHFPLLQFLYPAFQRSPYLATLVLLYMVGIVAYICWHLLEKPFLGQRLSPQAKQA
jgi:peptidoglycan/LPS O-acetylase OafA/YrhL